MLSTQSLISAQLLENDPQRFASERRYIEEFGEETTGLAAIKVDRGQIRLRLHINGNTEERIKVLIDRNPLALKLATAVVSNKLE